MLAGVTRRNINFMLNFLSVTLWGAKLRKLTEKHVLMDRNKISKTLLFGLSVGRNNLMHLKVSCSFLGFISSLNWFSWAFQLLRHLSFKSNLLAHSEVKRKTIMTQQHHWELFHSLLMLNFVFKEICSVFCIMKL